MVPTIQDVILVRHGESMANVSGRFAYQVWDPPLSPKGQAQAEHLAEFLAPWPITSLVSSPLRRARDSIAPLARRLDVEPALLPALIEVNLGRWDGAVLEDLRLSDRTRFLAWSRDPESFPPPEGESILTVGQRVLSGLDDFLADRSQGLTVAATHADCLKGAALVVLDAPGRAARRMLSPNIALLHLRRNLRGHWSLVLNGPPPSFDEGPAGST